MSRIGRIWRGDIRLVIAFWLFGVAVLLAANLLISAAILPIAALGPVATLAFITVSGLAVLLYQAVVTVGIWRSAGAYRGWRGWCWTSRVAVVMVWVPTIVAVWSTVAAPSQIQRSGRNSANAARSLRRDSAYPLAGFWKESCTDSFGLLVEPSATAGKYSVSFCGPGGCFPPGSYRPDTSIAGDRDYRVVDRDHLEVLRQDGKFGMYLRCE